MPVIDKVIVGDVKCSGCVAVAQRALEQVAVIEAVSANFRKQTCSFEFLRPVELHVIDQALGAVGHATVSAAAPAPAPGADSLTRLVREVVDGKSVRRYRCGCGCAECVCSDKPVWPGDEGVEVTLEGLCDRLRTTGFGDGSLFSGDGLVATLRANGDAAATLLDAWDGRRVPCGCGGGDAASPAPAAPVEAPAPAPVPEPVAAPAPAKETGDACRPGPSLPGGRERCREQDAPRPSVVSTTPGRFDALSVSPPASPRAGARPRSPLVAQRRRPHHKAPPQRRRPPPRRRTDDDDALAEALAARRRRGPSWLRAAAVAAAVAVAAVGYAWREASLDAVEQTQSPGRRADAATVGAAWFARGDKELTAGDLDAAASSFAKAAASSPNHQYHSAYADVVLSRALARYLAAGADAEDVATLCNQLPTCVRARVAAAAAGDEGDASEAALAAGLRDALGSFDGAMASWPGLPPGLNEQQVAQVNRAVRALEHFRNSTRDLIARIE
ncbi:unnamed protein product [Pelagomonas calceolata]|uniref:HMA domain-containing protein n=1 Tax=Pelagomonas calceolata TaxID=35677 RepID=A0A8J2WVU8_9STRA|nr:unnamed protein product [Pelagomonas calceolata]